MRTDAFRGHGGGPETHQGASRPGDLPGWGCLLYRGPGQGVTPVETISFLFVWRFRITETFELLLHCGYISVIVGKYNNSK